MKIRNSGKLGKTKMEKKKTEKGKTNNENTMMFKPSALCSGN